MHAREREREMKHFINTGEQLTLKPRRQMDFDCRRELRICVGKALGCLPVSVHAKVDAASCSTRQDGHMKGRKVCI